MQAAQKAVVSLVKKEKKRVLLVTLGSDGELYVQGDSASFDNLFENNSTKEALMKILSEEKDSSETAYNFGENMNYKETDNYYFPKMFAKIGGKHWKGGEVLKTLGQYFAVMGFGLNAVKTYGKEEDKPAWWPRKPKWKYFRSPSKASKEEATTLIKCMLEYYNIDPNVHYVAYPKEEDGRDDSSSSSSDDEEGRDDESL